MRATPGPMVLLPRPRGARVRVNSAPPRADPTPPPPRRWPGAAQAQPPAYPAKPEPSQGPEKTFFHAKMKFSQSLGDQYSSVCATVWAWYEVPTTPNRAKSQEQSRASPKEQGEVRAPSRRAESKKSRARASRPSWTMHRVGGLVGGTYLRPEPSARAGRSTRTERKLVGRPGRVPKTGPNLGSAR